MTVGKMMLMVRMVVYPKTLNPRCTAVCVKTCEKPGELGHLV